MPKPRVGLIRHLAPIQLANAKSAAGDPFPVEGGACANASDLVALIGVMGLGSLRLRFKADCDGTLVFKFVRDNDNALTDTPDYFDTKPVADTATVADTESVVSIPVEGEALLEITWTPGDDGVVDFAWVQSIHVNV